MNLKPIKILLADNNAANLTELKDILERHNYICQVFSSPKQIPRVIETDPTVDLIISDLFPPKNIGLELAGFIKRSIKFRDIPIILFSDNWDNGNIIKCAALGIHDLMIKPFEENQLLEKINTALARGKKNLLIIDDDPEILGLLKQVFELERFNVLTAESAEDGWEIILNDRVDAVITDILLPNMSGGELIAKIRAEYKDLPIIVITGHGGEFTPEMASRAGINGYFHKPFSNIELVRQLRAILTPSKSPCLQ